MYTLILAIDYAYLHAELSVYRPPTFLRQLTDDFRQLRHQKARTSTFLLTTGIVVVNVKRDNYLFARLNEIPLTYS